MIIYKIENKVNNMIYIGQTIRTLKRRLSGHLYKGNKSYLSNSLNKYGIDGFTITIIDELDNINDLNMAETYYIKRYNCLYPHGYNLEEGGKNSIMSEETKKKISVANTGKKPTEETKKKISESMRGKKPWNKGVESSNETRERQRKSMLGKNKVGQPRSEETRKKMSESAPKTKSDEHKKKLSESKLGSKNPSFGKKPWNYGMNKEEMIKYKKNKEKL